MQRHLTGRVDDVFHEALAEAEQSDAERRSAVRRTNLSFCEKSLAMLLDAEHVVGTQPTARASNCYRDDAATDQGASPDPPLPSLHSEVANILGVDAASTRDELIARRREFARRYHPDVVSSARRSRAEDLMKIANAIIDDRLSALTTNY